MKINTRLFTPLQNLVGEALGLPGETCLYFTLIAKQTNAGAQPTYGDAANNCILSLDFTFPNVPNESYKLAEIFAQTYAPGDSVILVYCTKG